MKQEILKNKYLTMQGLSRLPLRQLHSYPACAVPCMGETAHQGSGRSGRGVRVVHMAWYLCHLVFHKELI